MEGRDAVGDDPDAFVHEGTKNLIAQVHHMLAPLGGVEMNGRPFEADPAAPRLQIVPFTRTPRQMAILEGRDRERVRSEITAQVVDHAVE